ncbi:RTA1 [Candida metapsilosis]|uniref:RTA1 n=1 Tax=Candida metapsilosis TaxID=273372 RepID=A0A8H7ZCJ7_9ASCO|nr:RTA1 [Candida metapsilosis]
MTQETTGYQYYQYTLNYGVTIHYAVIFLVLATIETYFVVSKYNQFKGKIRSSNLKRYCNVMIPFIIGIVLEIIGYTARAVSSKQPQSLMPYVIQSVFILIGPTLILASTYMIFCELAKSLRAESYSVIPLKYLAKVFVTGDIVSLFVQANGGGLQVMDSLRTIGRALVITGVVLQLAFFTVFCYVFVSFTIKILRNPTKVAQTLSQVFPRIGNWKHGIVVLSFSCIFLMIRSVYRCVEMIEGHNGLLQSSEIYLWCLDTVMVQLAIYFYLTFNWTGYFCRVHEYYGSVFECVELESIIN